MTSQKNLSFVLEKAGSVKFEDRPVPKIENADDVLVQVKVTGICGSDVHFWKDGRIGSFVVKKPMVLGHESAGVIVETGKSVTALQPGDRVALEPGISCRVCDQCKRGKYNLCREMRFAATPPHDGTLAKYYVLPADMCVKLPESVSLEEGALVEPLSVAVHFIRQSGLTPGQTIVVYGAGPVGLLTCAVARAFGASKVIAVDIVEARLKFAKELAATHTFLGTKGAAELVKELDLGAGADVVIDASGAEQSIRAAVEVVRPGGTYVQGGMGKADVNFPITELCIKEVVLKGSFRYGPGDYQLAVDMLAQGRVSVKALISQRFKFEEAESAFTAAKEGKGIKMLILGEE